MAKMHPFWWFKAVPIPCPEGEQIVNGGFETGDTTGWAVSAGIFVEDWVVRSGIYALYTPSYMSFSQTLQTPTPVVCVKTFEIYLYSITTESYLLVIITYADDTETQFTYQPTEAGAWNKIDIKPYLTSGKTIAKITLTNDGDKYQGGYFDDCSLLC